MTFVKYLSDNIIDNVKTPFERWNFVIDNITIYVVRVNNKKK